MRHIPNMLTCLNLFCGCVASVMILQGNFEKAGWLLLASLTFDFADGFAARVLNSTSEIGRQLDSLADVVSFGLVPSFSVYYLWNNIQPSFAMLPYLSFVIAVFSAVRLAKFNVDIRQKEYFMGLPTPANAVMISFLPLIRENYSEWNGWFGNQWVLIFIIVFSCCMLVSGIPMLAFKFRRFGWKGNELRYALIAIAMVLIALLKIVALPVIILLYVFISVLLRRKIAGSADS